MKINKRIFTRLFFIVSIIPLIMLLIVLSILAIVLGWLFTGENWSIAIELSEDIVEMYYEWLCEPKNKNN